LLEIGDVASDLLITHLKLIPREVWMVRRAREHDHTALVFSQ
jgi:hypothetical protein